MDDDNNKPAENTHSEGEENRVPPNVFLVKEGVNAIPLNQHHITIGRSHENVIVVDDPRVSRFHMEIRVIRGRFVLFDLNSTGGTYVNGQRTNQVVLYSGDLISLGGVRFVFTEDTRLTGRGTDPVSSKGPGERNTVIFKSSIYPDKKDNDSQKK